MRAHDKENHQNARLFPRHRSSRADDAGALTGLQALQRAVGNAAVARALAGDEQQAAGLQGHGLPPRSLVHDVLRFAGVPEDPVRSSKTVDTIPHGTDVQRAADALPIQRAEDEDVQEATRPEQRIIDDLVKSGHATDDAWELMRHLTSKKFTAGEGQDEFNILNHIKFARDKTIKPVIARQSESLLQKKWTIRHYSGKDPNNAPGFDEIASTYDNAAAGRPGAHTNLKDWNTLGNIKFTFYLLAVDGAVPNRPWLNHMHWYAEWDLDDIADCWVSPDLLEKFRDDMDADQARAAMQGVRAFRGSGSELKTLLAASIFNNSNNPGTALDNAIGGNFELKVPAGLKVSKWEKNNS